MSERGDDFRRALWRAPAKNGGVLVEPEPTEWIRHFRRNRELLVSIGGRPFAGKTLGAWRDLARRETLQAAKTWTEQVTGGPIVKTTPEVPILASGHQPELFHPGVWAKNAALFFAAKKLGAVPLNLVIDGDLQGPSTIRVPTGTVEEPFATAVPFDEVADNAPWFQQTWREQNLAYHFPDKTLAALGKFGLSSLLHNFWPLVQARVGDAWSRGATFAAARREYEGRFDFHNLEVLQSCFCRTSAFAAFVAEILQDAHRFREQYNQSLADYRTVHHLRSRLHPAPDLEQTGDWIETPFWVSFKGQVGRSALWVKSRNESIELSDRDGWRLGLPGRTTAEFVAELTHLFQQESSPFLIFTRALTTTLYARLFLCDAFIHGVGGAKYDEVVDAVISQRWSIKPPTYFVVSATLRLPIEREPFDEQAGSRLRRRLWEYRHHPEKFLPGMQDDCSSHEARENLTRKKDLVQRFVEGENSRDLCHAVREVNQRLFGLLQEEYNEREHELAVWRKKRKSEDVIAARDYSFIFFNEKTLHRLFEKIETDFGDH